MDTYPRSPISFDYKERQQMELDLQKQYYQARIDLEYQQALSDIRREREVAILREKAAIAEKASEAKAKRTTYREIATFTIAEDTFGDIRYIMFLEDEEMSSRPFLSVRHLHMLKLKDENNTKHYFMLSWDGCEKPIVLLKPTVKGLEKSLMTNGIKINLSRRKKNDVLDLLLAYLFDTAKEVVIPRTAGWYFNEDEKSWCFCKEQDFSLEMLEEGDDDD